MTVPSVAARVPWLARLKGVQLQRLARATGIQSTGTKAIVAERIGTALRDYEPQSTPHPHSGPADHGSSLVKTRRILSIDMGVRNFAFAHFESRSDQHGRSAAPELTAWRRLAVSDIGELEPVSETDLSSPSPSPSETEDPTSESEAENQLDKNVEDEKYEPHVYAATAYTLITTLLATYRPTHVLIERQRFRSGSSKVVLEWSLRVGVLESMLYAVLHALREERGEMARMHVQGVEPKRVVQYWVDRAKSDPGSGLEVPTEKITAKQMKKAKIDLVGRWLDGSVGAEKAAMLGVGSDAAVADLVDSYLRKWKSPRARSKDVLSTGKLDDLADCLLQGVTWLEWQAVREKLAREGEKALPSIL